MTIQRRMRLLGSLLVLVIQGVKSQGSVPPSITFGCDGNTIKDIQAVNNNAQLSILLPKSNGYCRYKSAQSGACSSCCTDVNMDQELTITLAKTTDLSNGEVIVEGPTFHRYNLVCSDPTEFDVQKSVQAFSVNTPTPVTVTAITRPIHANDLQLDVVDSTGNHVPKAEIGTELFLRMKIEDTFEISPKSCEASDTTGLHKYLLWEREKNAQTCISNDKSIIPTEKWIPKDIGKTNEIKKQFFAFRFVDSDVITITCTAHICKAGTTTPTCQKKCISDSNGRRKRSEMLIENVSNRSFEKKASVSFQVTVGGEKNSSDCMSARKTIVMIFWLVTFLFLKN